MTLRFVLIFLSTFLASNFALSETIKSGLQQVQLIELFTSEGCSSCPPADRWLNAFENHPDLWKFFVPLAFHVDYWDYIGWKDRFAKAEFSERQRRYKVQGNSNGVYTPGFIIQGKEWRGWFQRHPRPSAAGKNIGTLKIQFDKNSATVGFSPIDPMQRGILNFALLGFDIEHAIRRGENAGVRLHHEFVVLDHWHEPANSNKGSLKAKFPIKRKNYRQYSKLAVAAWVSSIDNQRPLQAAGGWYQAKF